MTARILVTYASRKGSTAGIAEAIAKEIRSANVFVDTIVMKEVSSLDDYDAVIIGAPVYTGKVIGDLALFVAKYRNPLLRIPVAAFTAGIAPVFPRTGEVRVFTDQLIAALQPIIPVDVTMFAGALDPGKLSFVERGLTSLLKAPAGDFRDWGIIAAWARSLPAKMGLFS